MDRLKDMPLVTTDDDWLELAEGERCVVRGRLYGSLVPGNDSLVVAMASWEVVAVTITSGYDGIERRAGESVVVIATRTEDGLEAANRDISINEEN